MNLTAEQQEQQKKWGHEFYDDNGRAEFSQVRTNMMQDRYYTPYCIPCPGLQRFDQLGSDNQMTCPKCGNKTSFDIEFINRFKAKHNIV